MLYLRDVEIVTNFCEVRETGSVIFKGVRKYTACHNQAPVDDDFRRKVG